MKFYNRCLIVITLTVLATSTGCGRFLVNQFSFFPEPGSVVDINMLPPHVTHHYLKTPDGETVSSFYFKRDTDDALIFFHGNAGNASHRLMDAQAFWNMGLSVLLMDYRGYGLSSGSPSEEGIYIDGRAGLLFLTSEQKIPEENIFVLGRSIGSSVAVDLASVKKTAGVILISPFTSGRAMASYQGLGWAGWMIGNPFDNIGKIKNINQPLLVIHGNKDTVVPFNMGLALYKAAEEPRAFMTVSGAGHNDIFKVFPAATFKKIYGFVK